MTTFITSDRHVGHDNIRGYASRPFDSVGEMNLALFRNNNEVVGEDDDVWIVGDEAMGRRKDTLQLVSLFNGNKYLIPGNHDYCHPMYEGEQRFKDHVKMYEDAGLTILPPQLVCTFTNGVLEYAESLDDLDVNTTDFVFRLCHFPYTGDSHHDERYVEYRPIDDGIPLLHGHTHSHQAYRGNQVDVGVDAWNFYPQRLGDILAGFTNTED